jgi:hypothetical protein
LQKATDAEEGCTIAGRANEEEAEEAAAEAEAEEAAGLKEAEETEAEETEEAEEAAGFQVQRGHPRAVHLS